MEKPIANLTLAPTMPASSATSGCRCGSGCVKKSQSLNFPKDNEFYTPLALRRQKKTAPRNSETVKKPNSQKQWTWGPRRKLQGMSGFCKIPTKTPVRGTLGHSFWGPHRYWFCNRRDFQREWHLMSFNCMQSPSLAFANCNMQLQPLYVVLILNNHSIV